MNFEEQISAFMDGALTSGEETEFLHILSVSPEKRALFHSYLGTRSVFAADARSAAVPSHLDMAILGAAGAAAGGAAAGGAIGAAGTSATIGAASAAGAAIAAAGGTVGTAGTALSGAAFWTAGRVITAVLLGLSLFTGGWYLSDMFSPGTESTTGVGVTSAPSAPSAPSVPSAASNEGTQAARTGHGEQNGTLRIVYRNVYVTRVDTVFVPAQEAAAASEPMIVQRYDTVLIALMQTAQDQRPIEITEQPYAMSPVSLPGRIEFELQREHLTTYPYIDYSRVGASRTQQQFAASLGYVFNEHHAAGIMAGEKSFAMEYYRIENDSLFLFQQQPALFYGAGFYRYSQPLFSGVTPELTLQIGGCDYGPVFGARIGVRFDPIERISLVLGGNGTLLAYKYKDKLFTSHSLGISYGIRYRF